MTRILALFTALMLVSPALADETNVIRFTGKVTDAQARPLADVSIAINRVSGAPIIGAITNLTTTSASNGAFELPLLLGPTTQKSVACELQFARAGYVRVDQELSVAGNQSTTNIVDVTLQPGLILSGVIREPRRNQPPITHVFGVLGDNFEQYFAADAKGAFTVYVPPGKYDLKTLTTVPELTLKGVAAGSTNLVLTPMTFDWTEANIAKIYDDFCREFDRKYSYFVLKTNVDWSALTKEFRAPALKARSTAELADVLRQLLAPLQDLHVWLEWPGGGTNTYSSSYKFNGNGKVTRAAITNGVACGKFALVGRSQPDGFGYFLMLRQSNATEELVQQALKAMDQLRDAPGFIVDLRAANGGSEPLAQKIASWFCARETVYAGSKYRNGASHAAFTRMNSRPLAATANAYTKPVVCLVGPGAVSSGEGFAKMMMALPHVTTVGMPTRGASGNPKPYALGTTGLTVMFSTWVDMLPNGQTFEGRGLPPDVLVDEPASAYTDRDSTLEKGLALLREKIGSAK